MGVTQEDLQHAGMRLTVAEFESIVLQVVQGMPTADINVDPAHELTEAERCALEQGGGVVRPILQEEGSALERTAAKYAALLATSYTVHDVAEMLGVDKSRVRQRLGERSLYGIKLREGWRIPRFQFDGCKTIPGVDSVIAAMPADMHPLEFQNWFTLPDPELELDDVAVSPSDWLRSGGDPGIVAALAASFEYDD